MRDALKIAAFCAAVVAAWLLGLHWFMSSLLDITHCEVVCHPHPSRIAHECWCVPEDAQAYRPEER